jgi:hypothetical protein
VGGKPKPKRDKPELEIRVEFLPEEERAIGQERLRRIQRWLLTRRDDGEEEVS